MGPSFSGSPSRASGMMVFLLLISVKGSSLVVSCSVTIDSESSSIVEVSLLECVDSGVSAESSL